MASKSKYNFAFTAGALLLLETKEYVSHINDINAYLIHEEQVDYMVLPTNSESSKKRLKSEIDKRLRSLNATYIEAFQQMESKDQNIILFLGICKSYKIIADFCLEVVYQKWKMFDNELGTYDFQYFMSSKLSNEQLDSLTDKTQYKASQVTLRILKDIGLLVDDKIKQPYLSDTLRQLIEANGDAWFLHCILHSNS